MRKLRCVLEAKEHEGGREIKSGVFESIWWI